MWGGWKIPDESSDHGDGRLVDHHKPAAELSPSNPGVQGSLLRQETAKFQCGTLADASCLELKAWVVRQES